jgi:MoaA/NifB/PqqE/SkfB family radical SAM enzyme
LLLISPGGRCNLACKGCYAASHPGDLPSLDAETFNRILHEKRDLWGSYFTVISGGEPLLWQDGEWDILKIIEHHPTQLFLMYTNGTLITDEVARKMADLGNITPAISVEGFESQTDDRRGKGVFKKILTAFENLRRHGVPFGVSATPTRWNWDVITSDAFVDFYFEQQGALYAWLFQYMPIGRGHSTDMMVPPKDRVEMMHRMNRLIRERKAFMADFWNSGPVSRGCISAGRSYGYFYIDWNGDISPCSFVPYAAGNIHDIYASGGDLNTVLNLPFFKRIREWQNEYGYEKPNQEIGNWLCPCIMRDHFSRLKDIALETKAEPINKEAAEALHDMEYFKRMIEYDEEIDRLTQPIWTEEYLNRSETKENNSNIKVEQDPVTEMAHR